jgi:hypothetical protein
MSELDISEKRVPQDGRFKLRIKGRTVDFRVSIMPSVHGEDCVIRILDKESTNREFASLSLDVCGFEEREVVRMRRFIKEPYGMVLVTGPTGSGKTTRTRSSRSRTRSSTSFRGSPRSRSTRRRGSRSRAAYARSSATTRTRSWSARSATPRPRRSRSNRP